MPVVWSVLGLVIFLAAIRAARSPQALRVGRWAVGALFIGAGAGVNAWYLARGDDYGGFADGSQFAFVREAWRSVVAPDQVFFISLLIAFELAVGALVLGGDRRSEWGLIAAIGFHVALMTFGWAFALWSVPMLFAFALLLRAQRMEDPHPRAHRMRPARPGQTVRHA